MLNLVKEKIENYKILHSVPCGLVITGGASQINGLSSLANTIFDMPVRTGVSIEVEGPSEVIGNPIYSTGVGLLKYAYQMEKFIGPEHIENKKRKDVSLMDKFRKFILKVLRSEN
jgi:cell division protein FtsA